MGDVNSNELHLLLGRVEGKIDMVLGQQSVHSARIDAQDKRLTDFEARLTAIETTGNLGRANKSLLLSVASVFIAGVALVKGWLGLK